MYAASGQQWYQAMSRYQLVEQALRQQDEAIALSHLGEAIVRLQRALALGRRTMPVTIRTQAKQSLAQWYELFIELYQRCS